jgi:hypothetical protein
VPPELPAAIRDLAGALRGVATHLKRPGDEWRVGETAREAAGRASTVLSRDENVSVSMIVGHVQATAVDALRSLGVDRLEAHAEIGEVARDASADDRRDGDGDGADRAVAGRGPSRLE